MTKKLLALLLFAPLFAQAQSDKSTVRIGLTGNYADVAESNGVFSLGSVNTTGYTWETGVLLGVAMTERWELGIGVHYTEQKSTANARMYFERPMQPAVAEQTTTTKTSMWSEQIYLTYYQPIVHRLYFTPSLSLLYGRAYAKVDVTGDYRQIMVISEPSTPYFNSYDVDPYDVSGVLLTPGLTFFATKHLAFTLDMGVLQFSTIDWKWSNHRFIASFYPTYWQWGMIVAF